MIFSPSISPGFNRGRIRVSGMAAGYGNPAVSSPQTIEVMANGIEKPFLIVIPTAMTNRVLQGFNAPNLSMGILNATKSGRLRFLIQDNVSWVEPMPASGTLGGNLTETSVSLQFATENLAPGRHAATMTVMAEDAVHGGPVQGSPVTIDVLLDVTPLAVLGLDHISLSQYARQGATPASQSFKICNASPAPKGTLAFELEVESTWVDEEEHPPRQAASAPLPPWLSVSPSSGMSDGEWVEATVSYDTTGLAPGLYHGRIQVTGRDVVGQRDAMNSPLEVIASLRVLRPTPGDITGDICGELVLYSANAGSWYVYNLASGAVSFGELFGGPDYEPLLGDFDGDGRADLCVYRGITAGWYARQVGHERLLVATSFGAPGFVPVTSDFDGDGIADIGVYDPSTGLWYIIRIDGRLLAWSYAWGGPGYKPVVADFDGDARCDLAVYHEETGRWYATGLFSGLIDWNVPWGGPGLIGMAGDFDADGRDDLVVYQESSGNWYVWSILKGVLIWGINWGGPGFTPVLGDFDGDGVADIAVYHEHTGTWYGRTVSGELLFWGLPWGGPGMQPL